MTGSDAYKSSLVAPYNWLYRPIVADMNQGLFSSELESLDWNYVEPDRTGCRMKYQSREGSTRWTVASWVNEDEFPA
jgi:expansin (peptidoglycan-binding protein)